MSDLRSLRSCRLFVGWSTLAFAAVSAGAGVPSQTPLPANAVTEIGGFVGERLRANRENDLKRFDIDAFVRKVETPRQTEWWWIGEQPGKWLEAAVLTAASSGDAELMAKARAVLARLEAAQEASGYLGITAPELRTAARPLRGMDPYELYFTMHGLLTAHEVLGDEHALTAAKRLGDYFVKTIGPGKAEFWPSPYRPPENGNAVICPQVTWVPPGTPRRDPLFVHSEIAGHTAHYGWEGTLLQDPMFRLYQATGVSAYRDWAEWVVGGIDRWSGWWACSRLDDVAAGKIGVHELQPYVHSHTFQMNFLGFLRLYEISGDKIWLNRVMGAWKDVCERQCYITGGVSVGEHYEPDHILPLNGSVVETCATYSWLLLSQRLLELTGDARCADIVERLLFNHVFAAQTVDGDCFRYHTPPNGFKPDDYFHGPDCCTSSGPLLLSKLPGLFFSRRADGLAVNQYVSSRVRAETGEGAAALTLTTDYPATETVTVRIDQAPAAAYALYLRLPGWCRTPSVSVNGVTVRDAKPGAYCCVKRVWRAGDTLALRFPMRTEWVARTHWSGAPDAQPFALIRGPVVYALDSVWWPERTAGAPPRDVSAEAAVDRSGEVTAIAQPADARALGPFLEGGVALADGRAVRSVFVPFANIGRWYREGQAKPDAHSRAFSYAVWLPDAGSPTFRQRAGQALRDAKLRSESVDFVVVGDAESERAHRVGGGTTGVFNGRTYRHGDSFSYRMKVNPDAPCLLNVTYWGGEPALRTFAVYLNDAKIAEERLNNDRPGEFFERCYPVPQELVKGKTNEAGQKVDTVVVRFQGEVTLAGGVFGLRTTVR